MSDRISLLARCTARANRFTRLRLLLARRTVFLVEMLEGILALGRHLRIQLERLKTQLGGHARRDVLEGGFERAQADGTPGAGHVGYEIDMELGRHGTDDEAVRATFNHPAADHPTGFASSWVTSSRPNCATRLRSQRWAGE